MTHTQDQWHSIGRCEPTGVLLRLSYHMILWIRYLYPDLVAVRLSALMNGFHYCSGSYSVQVFFMLCLFLCFCFTAAEWKYTPDTLDTMRRLNRYLTNDLNPNHCVDALGKQIQYCIDSIPNIWLGLLCYL